MVLLSAQGMDVSAIAKVALTSEDRGAGGERQRQRRWVRLLYPMYHGGRVPKFTLAHRRESKKIAKSTGGRARPWPFSTWSLPELAEFLSGCGTGRRAPMVRRSGQAGLRPGGKR